VAAQPQAFLERDALLRDLARRREARRGASDGFVTLYRMVLQTGYERAAVHLDVAGWASSREARLGAAVAVNSVFFDYSRARFAELAGRTASATTADLLSAAYPPFSEILDSALSRIFRVADPEDRFLVCLFLLKDDALGYRQHEVMVNLLGVVRELLESAHAGDFNRLLARLTRFFHQREKLFPEMRFLIYEAVGQAIGQAGAYRAADHLIDDLLSWRFEFPEIQGATDEWRTVVNRYHLPNVRCWLRIVSSNPLLYERLAAALNVQLRLGGVFLADTDLFQKDVTAFLNADIGPIYFVAKQLLRTLPVYFNELGAEGELRSVSTEIDEVLGRRDTLLHFLRKQVHAESSNRLIGFSRAVLEYWASLDPEVLGPFVSENTMTAVRQEAALAEGPHRLLQAVAVAGDGGDPGRGLKQLLDLPAARVAARLEAVEGVSEADRRRLALLVRQDQLLREKYSLSSGNLEARVDRALWLPEAVRKAFAQAVRSWKEPGGDNPGVAPPAGEELLDRALDLLEELKNVVLSPRPSMGVENIYHASPPCTGATQSPSSTRWL
jgi:pyruvate,orthophosphate dikinase